MGFQQFSEFITVNNKLAGDKQRRIGMDEGEQLRRRLAFLDSRATEEAEADEEEDTGKNKKRRNWRLLQCTATTIAFKDRSVRGSQWAQIPAAHTR